VSVARPAGGEARNRALERRVLEAIVAQAQRRFNVGCGSYPGAVLRRLERGEQRFGDGAFMERDDLLEELREEALDLGGYALLVLQRLAQEPGGVPARVRADLLRVVLLGAVADYYARLAGRRLREGRPT
jgi:hypothetical protein